MQEQKMFKAHKFPSIKVLGHRDYFNDADYAFKIRRQGPIVADHFAKYAQEIIKDRNKVDL